MKTIVISNLKGGVGKTTAAANLAYNLSSPYFKQRVLVIDADPQANLTSFFLRHPAHGKSLADLLAAPEKAGRCIYRSRYPGIDIVRGNPELREKSAGKEAFSRALAKVQDRYDYCIIDTRPSFENITSSAVLAADLVLTPVRLDMFCRDNLVLVDEFIDRAREERGTIYWRVFANQADGRKKAQRKIYADLVGKHNYPFLETCIRRSETVQHALEYYKPVQKHRSGSPVCADYMELAAEVVHFLEETLEPAEGKGEV